jgi:hypothetical protein
MKMAGHKTQAIYPHYAIADEFMLKNVAEKLERLHSVVVESKNRRVAATSSIYIRVI